MSNSIPVFYNPSSEELPFYEHLFQTADVSKTGQINGRDAVTFLSKSKLPLDLLKNIWNIADQNPKTNTLDKPKFFIALRLIQLAQNGIDASGSIISGSASVNATGGDLALVEKGGKDIMRAPFFEGVTNANQPQQPQQQQPIQQQQQQQQQPSAMHTPIRPTTSAGIPQPTPQRPDFQSLPQQTNPAPTPQPPASQQQLTHDPYTMTPSEKSRYESLFPQYAKEDGYVYGKEAVELFIKSGMDKGLLRNIWNMVDTPVDNRLSKLEFAIAMHLIVCVSKKNLPMPSLFPPSLKGLKDMENASVGVAVGVGEPGVGVGAGGPGAVGGGNVAGGIPSPTPQSPPRTTNVTTNISSPPQQQQQPLAVAAVAAPTQQFSTGMALGGMSISDAFENMTTNDRGSTGGSDVSPTTAYSTTKQSLDGMSLPQLQTQAPPAVAVVAPQTQSGQIPAVATPMPLSVPGNVPLGILSTSSMGETSVVSTEELKNLQSVLQKMQAENVSLKAQLGQCSDEELSVRKEITQTVAEISSLSMELTALRAQVSDAKSSLIEATSELKAQIEKRDILRSLLEEAATTKKTIEDGALKIKQLEDIAREAKMKSKMASPPKIDQSASRDPPTPYDQGFFNYAKADSGSMNDFLKSQQSMEPPPSPAPHSYNTGQYQGNQPTPARNAGRSQQMPPMPPNDPPTNPSMYYPQQQQQQHHQQRALPDPPVDHIQKLEDLKYQAGQAERNAASAADQARAFAIQYEDLRAQAERAEIILNEMKPRKKGFFSGGKREAKKEMEQARQMAHVKTNEAQHAHLAMKKAEDEATKLRQEAKVLRTKAEEFELEMAKRASEEAEAQRVVEMQRMQNNTASIASDLSYSNSYATPMGFGGFPGTPAPAQPIQMNDPDIMGGSVGYGDGVMGGYASSVGFTDNSVYSMNNSITGSTNHGNVALPGGYTSDAASRSVTSEPLFYPQIASPTNGEGSVAGVLSTTGSIAQPGSVTNVPAGYTSDTGVGPEMLLPSPNDNNSLSNAETSTKPPLAANPESYTPRLDIGNNDVHPGINITATSASNDTETMNNTTSSNQNNGGGAAAEVGIEVSASQDSGIKKMASNDSSIGQMSSNDFGSFQGPEGSDFNGIPSPEKDDGEFIPNIKPTYTHTTHNEESKLDVHDQDQMKPVDPEPSTEDQVKVIISQETSKIIELKDQSLIPSPEKEDGEKPFHDEIVQLPQHEDASKIEKSQEAVASVEMSATEFVNSRSGETTGLETVYLPEDDSIVDTAVEKSQGPINNTMDNNDNNNIISTTQPSTTNGLIQPAGKESKSMTLGTATSEDGLIPSAQNELKSMAMGTGTSNNGLIPSPAKNANHMGLGVALNLTASALPHSGINNDGNNDVATSLPMMSKSPLTAPQTVMSAVPQLSLSMSEDNSINLGIMSQSTDGGIPTPTHSKDEFDKAFF